MAVSLFAQNVAEVQHRFQYAAADGTGFVGNGVAVRHLCARVDITAFESLLYRRSVGDQTAQNAGDGRFHRLARDIADRIARLDKVADLSRAYKRAVRRRAQHTLTGKTADEITAEFEGKGYGDFKTAVGEAVVEELKPVQEKYNMYISDKAQLEKIYKESAEKAQYVSRKTLSKVMKKVGYVL